MSALLLALSAHAVPLELDHSGRLMDGTGVPLTGPHDVEFLVYNDATGGSLVWSETHSLDFDMGYFDAVLGSITPLADNFFDVDLYITLSVDGAPELTDRKKLESVPFAIKSRTATDVRGGVVDASSILVNGTTVIDATGTVVAPSSGPSLDTLGCTTDQVPLFDGSLWTCLDAVTGAGAVDWTELTGKPSGFADDVDDDLLATLNCTDFQGLRWDTAGSTWTCYDLLDEATVDAYVSDNGFALDSAIAPIGKSGDWNDLVNVPAGFADGTDDDTFLTESDVDAFVANNGYALDADLANLARTGDWADIANMPGGFSDGVDDDTTLDEAAVDAFVANNGYVTSGSLAVIATTGNWADLLGVPGGFADGVDNQLDEAAVDAFVSDNGYALDADISQVGKSGLWNDLLSTPAGFADGVDNVLTESDVDAMVSNNGYASAASLATVATTGAYGDLSGTPSLASVATSGAYADLSGTPSLASVATSGDFADLLGVPAGLADGDDDTQLTEAQVEGFITNGVNVEWPTMRVQHPTAGGASGIRFDSRVNFGSDYGYILLQDETSNSPGSGGEDIRMVVGVHNDFRQSAAHSDELWLQGGGRLVQNVGAWDAELNALIGLPGAGTTGGYEWRVNNSVVAQLTPSGDLVLTGDLLCPTGYTAISGGRLCIDTTLRASTNMYNAITDCRDEQAHVCTHNDMQQACGVLNSYSGSATGWYGDHARVETTGNTDDEYLTWNRNFCDANNDGPAANAGSSLPYKCCM